MGGKTFRMLEHGVQHLAARIAATSPPQPSLTFARLPLRAACLACIICTDVAFSYGLRFLGPVLVMLANGLIGLVVYVYLTMLVPQHIIPDLGYALTAMLVIIGLYLLFNVRIYCFYPSP